MYNLLQSSSRAVKYEAAGTLITLSSAPTAIKAAASAYIDLIIKESDNNVKVLLENYIYYDLLKISILTAYRGKIMEMNLNRSLLQHVGKCGFQGRM